MPRVIDANVLKEYYQETVLELSGSLTGSVKLVFERDGVIYVDEGGQIEAEWASVVDRDWFEVWYSRQLVEDKIRELSVACFPELGKQLKILGFPHGSKDIWYVRTAKQCKAAGIDPCLLVSEDLDFFDPTRKAASGAARRTILEDKNAPIKRMLRNSESILVHCVIEFLSQSQG